MGFNFSYVSLAQVRSYIKFSTVKQFTCANAGNVSPTPAMARPNSAMIKETNTGLVRSRAAVMFDRLKAERSFRLRNVGTSPGSIGTEPHSVLSLTNRPNHLQAVSNRRSFIN